MNTPTPEDHPLAWLALARQSELDGDKDHAVYCLVRATHLCIVRGEGDRAMAMLDDALRLDPNHADARELAEMLRERPTKRLRTRSIGNKG